MSDFVQTGFLGGLNQQVESTRMDRNQFYFLRNARIRKDSLASINQHEDITSKLPPFNKLQGLWGGRNFILVIADGKAYYFVVGSNQTSFIQINEFQMDHTVDEMFVEFIPASTFNFQRILQTVIINGEVRTINSSTQTVLQNFSSTPSGILVQDGVTQPWIITTNFNARKTKNYGQWAVEDREYVPIGRRMLWNGRKLYIESPDGSEIFQSVSGRPLDFMVIIDQDGNKLSVEEGNASKVSYKVSFNRITALNKLPIKEAFFVSTRSESFFVFENEERQQFGEPTLERVDLFPTGPLNSYSLVDILGDTAFIDEFGIRTFNSRKTIDTETNEVGFSAPVQDLLDGVKQDTPCCIEDNFYALFAINSKYGRGILVYDKLLEAFVSFDDAPDQIIQFAYALSTTGRELYFRTKNRIYRAYSPDASTAKMSGFIGEFCSNDPKNELKPNVARFILNNVVESGNLTVSLYVDRQLIKILSEFVPANTSEDAIQSLPFQGKNQEDKVKNLTFEYSMLSRLGWKVGLYFELTAKAEITHISLNCEDVIPDVALEQVKKRFNSYLRYPDKFFTIDKLKPSKETDGRVIIVGGGGGGGTPELPTTRSLFFTAPIGTDRLAWAKLDRRTVRTHRTTMGITGIATSREFSSVTYSVIRFTSGQEYCGEADGCIGPPDTFETLFSGNAVLVPIETGVPSLGLTRYFDWYIPEGEFQMENADIDKQYWIFVQGYNSLGQQIGKDFIRLIKSAYVPDTPPPPDCVPTPYVQPYCYIDFRSNESGYNFDAVHPAISGLRPFGNVNYIIGPKFFVYGWSEFSTQTGVIGRFYKTADTLYNSALLVGDIVGNAVPCGFSIRVWTKSTGVPVNLITRQGDYFMVLHPSRAEQGRIRFSVYTQGQIPRTLDVTSVYDPPFWNHLVMTFDNRTRDIKGYVNGVLAGTFNIGTDPLNSPASADIRVGEALTLGGTMEGIDEICMWRNRVLTPDDVLYDYNSGNGRTFPLT